MAGCGKTLLSIAAAISMLHQNKFKKLILSRPVQSTSKDIGFLPGTKEEKLMPWLQPFFDNLEVIFDKRGKAYIDMLMKNGTIELEALTYIRGRTLPDTIFIIDEAQNITHHEAKALLTRMGDNSKIILIGDLEQIDSPTVDEKTSGLSSVVSLFKEFEHSGHIRLRKGERSKLATYAAKVM
jgi:PhoH-like ATPase